MPTPTSNEPLNEYGLTKAQETANAMALAPAASDEQKRAAARTILRNVTNDEVDSHDGSILHPERKPITGFEFHTRMVGAIENGMKTLETPESQEFGTIKPADLEGQYAHAMKKMSGWERNAIQPARNIVVSLQTLTPDQLPPDATDEERSLVKRQYKYRRYVRGQMTAAAALPSDPGVQPEQPDPAVGMLSPEENAKLDALKTKLEKRRVVSEYKAKLRAENIVLHYNTVAPDLGDTAKQIVKKSFRSNEIGDTEIEQFKALSLKEQQIVSSLVYASRHSADDGVLLTAGKQFIDTAWRTPWDAGRHVFVDSFQQIAMNPDEYNKRAQTRALLAEMVGYKPQEFGYGADAIIGAAASVPYMLERMIPVLGGPMIAAKFASDYEARVAAAGGDVTSPEFRASKWTAATMATAIEGLQANTAFRAPSAMQKRMMYLGVWKSIHKAAGVGKDILVDAGKEITEESMQQAIEDGFVAYGLDRNIAREAVAGAVQTLKDSAGSMLLTTAVGGVGKTFKVNMTKRLSFDEQIAARQHAVKIQRGLAAIDDRAISDDREAVGELRDTWFKSGGMTEDAVQAFKAKGFSDEHARAFADMFSAEHRVIMESKNMTPEQKRAMIGNDTNAKRMVLKAMPDAVVTDGQDGNFSISRKINGIQHTLNVVYKDGADFDMNSPAAAASIARALTGEGVAMTPEQWLASDENQKKEMVANYNLRANGYFTGVAPDVTDGTLNVLTGTITLDRAAHPATVFHEYFHSFARMMKDANWLTEADVAKLREEFGSPDTAGEQFNEEAASDAYQSFINGKLNPPNSSVLRHIWNAVVAIKGAITGAKGKTTDAQVIANIRESMFDQASRGNFSGIPVSTAASSQAAKDATPAATEPAGATLAADPVAAPSTGDGGQSTQSRYEVGDTVVGTKTNKAGEKKKGRSATVEAVIQNPDGTTSYKVAWDNGVTSTHPEALFAEHTPAKTGIPITELRPEPAQPAAPPVAPEAPAPAVTTPPAPAASTVTPAATPVIKSANAGGISFEPVKKQIATAEKAKDDVVMKAITGEKGAFTSTTPDGSITVSGRLAVMDATGPRTSDKPGYDKDLQDRLTGAVKSIKKIMSIGSNLQTSKLGQMPTTDRGAPILTHNGDVLAGNHRIWAILWAIANGKYADYERWVRLMAKENGIEIDPSIKHPVLVRIIDSVTDKEQLRKIARLSNRDDKEDLGESERALADAETIINNGMLSLYAPDATGNLYAASNRGFMTAFIHANRGEALESSKGTPTKACIDRVKNAMFAIVMNRGADGRIVTQVLLEEAGNVGMQSTVNGIVKAAGALARLAFNKPELSILDEVSMAVRELMQAKKDLDSGPRTVSRIVKVKDKDGNVVMGEDGKPKTETIDEQVVAYSGIDAWVNQVEMFAQPRSKEVNALIRELYLRPTSMGVSTLLTAYATLAQQVDKSGDIFNATAPSKQSLIARAIATTGDWQTRKDEDEEPAAPAPVPAAPVAPKKAEKPPQRPVQPAKKAEPFSLKPYAPTPVTVPAGTPVWEAIGQGDRAVNTSNATESKWKWLIPNFQGGKYPLADRATKAIRSAMPEDERSRITHIVDHFGGGGSWGLFHALESFPNVVRLTIREFNAGRREKIRVFHELGDQFAVKLDATLARIENVVIEAMKRPDKDDDVSSGTSVAKAIRENIDGITDKDEIGVLWALIDAGTSHRTAAKDASGKKSPSVKIKEMRDAVVKEAAEAFKGAEAYRKRGGTIELLEAGSSYDAKPYAGSNVLSILDPPYVYTADYNGKNTVGLDTYAKTRDLINATAEAGNAILYTDAAFWTTEGFKPQEAEALFGNKHSSEQQILLDIAGALDQFDVIDGKVGQRYETIGINHAHGTDQGKDATGQSQSTGADGAVLPGGAGRQDSPAGANGDIQDKGVQGLAPGDAGGAGPIRSGSDQVDGPRLSISARIQDRPALKGNPTPATDKAFGEWSAVLGTDRLKGYRGFKGDKVSRDKQGFGGSEGQGIYIAKTSEMAEFFGRPVAMKFDIPKNSLVVEETDPLFILSEDHPGWADVENPDETGANDWLKAHKRAFIKSGVAKKWDADKMADALTDEMLAMGYDSVYVKSGGDEWVVLLRDQNVTVGSERYSISANQGVFDFNGTAYPVTFKNTPEQLARNPATVKHMKMAMGGTAEARQFSQDFHARSSRMTPGVFYRWSPMNIPGYKPGTNGKGAGDGLYIGRDPEALASLYGEVMGEGDGELVAYRQTGPIKWLDLTDQPIINEIEKQAIAQHFKPTPGQGVLAERDAKGNALREYALANGYDGVRYYDPEATGEEFVLYRPELLVDVKTGQSRYNISAEASEKLYARVMKDAHPADRMTGDKAWLTRDGKWLNVEHHIDALPNRTRADINTGEPELMQSGLVRVTFEHGFRTQLNAEHAPGMLTHAQRTELKNTAIERHAEVQLDPGQAWGNGTRYTINARRAFASAKRNMGTTTDLREAGYILPDGTMLDFSGKAESGITGKRHIDHRDVIYDGAPPPDDVGHNTPSMLNFMALGAMRVAATEGVVNISRPMTPKQEVIARKILMDTLDDRASIEANRVDGKHIAFNPTTEKGIDRAIAEVTRFLNGEDVAVGARYSMTAAQDRAYPVISEGKADGRSVLDDVPNVSSIRSSLENYTILKGIRDVPMSEFTGLTGSSYSAQESDRIANLAESIRASNAIKPLIVVLDNEPGPYILEGGHRAEALYKLGAKSIPALVVVDHGNVRYSMTATDDAYMKALASDDTDTAGMLVREQAHAAGYKLEALHGTDSLFNRFDPKEIGTANDLGYLGEGFYFTNTRSEATAYGDELMHVYLKLDNPVRLALGKGDYMTPESEATLKRLGIERTYRLLDPSGATKAMKAAGYDGVILTRTDSPYEEYVAFSPEQIKSADVATLDAGGQIIPPSARFNSASDDIRYSVQGSIPKGKTVFGIINDDGDIDSQVADGSVGHDNLSLNLNGAKRWRYLNGVVLVWDDLTPSEQQTIDDHLRDRYDAEPEMYSTPTSQSIRHRYSVKAEHPNVDATLDAMTAEGKTTVTDIYEYMLDERSSGNEAMADAAAFAWKKQFKVPVGGLPGIIDKDEATIRRFLSDFEYEYERQTASDEPRYSVKATRYANATVIPPGSRLMVKAFHGTPHTFEPEEGAPLGRVKKEKVGTGEGAAAYGWGVLYTAQNKSVAESYKTAGGTPAPYESGFREIARRQGRSNTVVIGGELLNVWNAAVRAQDGEVEFMRSLSEEERQIINKAAIGNLYHIELAFDPEDCLDWDKPLSEQSNRVKKALVDFVKYGVSLPQLDKGKGGDEWYVMVGRTYRYFPTEQAAIEWQEQRNTAILDDKTALGGYVYTTVADRTSKQEASDRLSSLGIRGIRFADQGSRASDYTLRKKSNGKYELINDASMLQSPEFDTREQAAAWFNDRKTYNFVAFREEDIKVVGRNGELLKPSEATNTKAPAQQEDAPRNSMSANRGKHSNDSSLVAAAAARILAGKENDPQQISKLAKALGATLTGEQIIERAQAHAESEVGKAAAEALKSPDPTEAMTMIANVEEANQYLAAARSGVRKGAKAQATMTALGQKAEDAGMKKLIEAVKGENLRQLEVETGADLTGTLMALRPDDFTEKPAGADATGSTPEEQKPPNPLEFERVATPEELADRERRCQNAVDAAKAYVAAQRAKLAQRAAERAQRAAQGDQTEEDADAEMEEDTPLLRLPKELLQTANVDLSNAQEVARFIRLWIAAHMIDHSNGQVTPANVWTNPETREKYRKTIVQQLHDMADKLVDPTDRALPTIKTIIGDMASTMSTNEIERMSAHALAVIQRNAIRQTQSKLTSALAHDIKKLAKDGKQFDSMKEDLKRKVTAEVEQVARKLARIIYYTDKKTASEIERLDAEMEIIKEAVGESWNPNQQIEGDVRYHSLFLERQMVERYGGTKYQMPADIMKARTEIINWLTVEKDALVARWTKVSETADKHSTALASGIGRDPSLHGKPDKETFVAAFTDSMIATVRQRLQNLTKFATGQLKADAREATEYIALQMGAGSETYSATMERYRKQTDAILMTVSNGKMAEYQAHLEAPIPTSTSEKVCSLEQGFRQSMTYGQAVALYMAVTQTSYQGNVIHNNRQNNARQLEAILSAADMRLVMMLRQTYASRREDLSDVVKEVIGTPVWSPDPNYSPVRMWLGARGGLKMEVRSYHPVAKALTPRIKNKRDFDERMDVMVLLARSNENSARAIAFGVRGIAIRSVLGRKAVQDNIVRYHGEQALTRLLEQVNDHLIGIEQTADAESRLIKTAMKITTFTALSGNMLSAAKQLGSLPAWGMVLEGGLGEAFAHMANFDMASAHELANSDGFKARYGAGMMREIAEILAEGKGNWIKRLYVAGMKPLEGADMVASLLVGTGLYKAKLNALLRQGMAPEEANRTAKTLTFNLIEECQQSARPENMSAGMRRGGAGYRLLYQFASAPMLQLSHEMQAARDWRAQVDPDGKLTLVQALAESARNAAAGTDDGKAKLVRILMINHVIIPAIMATTTALFNAALGDDDEDAETFFRQLGAEMIAGPLARIVFFGAVVEFVVRKAFSVRSYQNNGVPASSAIRLVERGVITALDIVTLDWDKLQEDALKLLESTGAPQRHIIKAVRNYSE